MNRRLFHFFQQKCLFKFAFFTQVHVLFEREKKSYNDWHFFILLFFRKTIKIIFQLASGAKWNAIKRWKR
jgi:hypothetical protein